MRKKFAEAGVKFLGLIFLLLLAYNCDAQDDANNHPKPFMWSPNKPEFIKNFKNKLKELNKYYNPEVKQPSSFILENFLGMINYFAVRYKDTFKCLHVYIAAYSENGSHVPAGYGKTLTLIFAPANGYFSSTNTDIAYYTIPPQTRFDASHADSFKIDDVQKEWRDNYTEKLMTSILKTIDSNDENMIDGKLSDTRCITYCSHDILELVAEQTYTHKNFLNKKIELSDSMLVRFAAFGEEGNTRRHNTGAKRLFVQFDFLDQNGKVRYLGNTKGFNGRTSAPEKTCEDCSSAGFNAEKAFYSTDNGTLCPPCTNCPPGTPGCDIPFNSKQSHK